MTAPTQADVTRVIADALGLEASDVGEQASMETVDAWDSLGHLGVVMAVEAAFGCRLEPDEITRLTSVSAIAAHLGSR